MNHFRSLSTTLRTMKLFAIIDHGQSTSTGGICGTCRMIHIVAKDKEEAQQKYIDHCESMNIPHGNLEIKLVTEWFDWSGLNSGDQ